MISKVIRGKTFYGACRYVCGDEHRAVILEAEGVRDFDYREMTRDFEAQHSLRQSLGKPVFHGILSFYPGEKPADETIIQIARSYLKQIAITDTQYVVTKHTDKDHMHLHILANMVNNKGETIKDNYIGLRGKKAAELITIGYHLREANVKDLAKTNFHNFTEREAVRYKIFSTINEQLPKCKTLKELEERLRNKGVETVYKYKGSTDEKQGISFSIGNYKFKGSEVDRNYSLNGLQKEITQTLNTVPNVRRRHSSNTSDKVEGSSITHAQESYLKMKEKDLLNTLLKPEEQSEMHPSSLLQKKRKKKRRIGL